MSNTSLYLDTKSEAFVFAERLFVEHIESPSPHTKGVGAVQGLSEKAKISVSVGPTMSASFLQEHPSLIVRISFNLYDARGSHALWIEDQLAMIDRAISRDDVRAGLLEASSVLALWEGRVARFTTRQPEGLEAELVEGMRLVCDRAGMECQEI